MNIKDNIKSIIGLFIPMSLEGYENKKEITLSIGGVPLGWIVVGISLIVSLIVKYI